MNEGRGLALMFALDLTATASTDLTVVYTSVHSQSQTVNCARTVRHVGGRCTPYMRFSVCLSVCLSVSLFIMDDLKRADLPCRREQEC